MIATVFLGPPQKTSPKPPKIRRTGYTSFADCMLLVLTCDLIGYHHGGIMR
jgi:hypothetical protein